jgi:hypothetical protein
MRRPRLYSQRNCSQWHSGPASTVSCTLQLKHLIWHINKTSLKTPIFKTPPSSGRQQTGLVTIGVLVRSHQSVRNTQLTRDHVVKAVRRHAWAAGASQPSVTRFIACEISSLKLRVACEAIQTTKGAYRCLELDAFNSVSSKYCDAVFFLVCQYTT